MAGCREAALAVGSKISALTAGSPYGGSDVGNAAAAVIAASVAEALATGGTERIVMNAIGLAASSASASGLGTGEPSVERAVDAGTHAARLATAGWDAPMGAIDGRKGLLAVLGLASGGHLSPAIHDRRPRDEWSALAEQIAAAVRRSSWSDFDGGHRAAITESFGNAVSLAMAASGTAPLRAAAVALDGEGGPRGRILGSSAEVAASSAAFVQAAAAHLEDFDDTHLASVVHPGAAIAATVLALANHTSVTGTDALTAFAAGVETCLLLGEMLPDALTRGWHMTGIAAPVGAAVTGAFLAGADERRLVEAIDAAAHRAAGLTEALGTLGKPMHVGNAARVGVTVGFEERGGRADGGLAALLTVLGAVPRDGFGNGRFGGASRIRDNIVKPYACGVLGHSSIDLALRLRDLSGGSELTSCQIRVNPLAVTAMGRNDPADGLESKFSVVHAFAVASLFGDADPSRFSDSAARDDRVRALRDRITLVGDDSCGRFESVVRASWPGGSRELRIAAASRPARDQVVAKAQRLLSGRSGAPEFIEAAFAADRLDRLAMLHQLSTPILSALTRTTRPSLEAS